MDFFLPVDVGFRESRDDNNHEQSADSVSRMDAGVFIEGGPRSLQSQHSEVL